MDILQSTDFWVVVSFSTFFILVIWKARGALTGAIDGRINRIRDEIATAERLKEEATAKLAELRRAQRDAGDQATAIVDAAKAETKSMKKDQDARFKEAMARREQQAMDKIAQAEANAMAEVRNKAVDIAIAATTAVLTQKMAGAAGDATIDTAIAKLPERLH